MDTTVRVDSSGTVQPPPPMQAAAMPQPQMQPPPPPAYDDTKPPQYPQQQMPYPNAAYGAAPQTVIIQGAGGVPQGPQTIIVQNVAALGHHPAVMVCPCCHVQMTTMVEESISSGGWIVAAILCLFGCWLCAWIPLVSSSNKEIRHVCPMCHAVVGTGHHIH